MLIDKMIELKYRIIEYATLVETMIHKSIKGLLEKDEQIFRFLISKPYGIILVTGPTGSGKTTTLYAVLNQIDKLTKKIIII